MKNRRSLTPTPKDHGGDVHAMRRGGARRETSARVTLTPAGSGISATRRTDLGRTSATLEGWALNVSRGGLRVILEDRVELGAQFAVAIAGGAMSGELGLSAARLGRVVWVQEEPDGVVAGIEFREDE